MAFAANTHRVVLLCLTKHCGHVGRIFRLPVKMNSTSASTWQIGHNVRILRMLLCASHSQAKVLFLKCIIPHWAHSSPRAQFGRGFFFFWNLVMTQSQPFGAVKVRDKVQREGVGGHRETQIKWEWGRQRGQSRGGGRGRLESGEKAAVPLQGLSEVVDCLWRWANRNLCSTDFFLFVFFL